ncbi:MAG: M23 family metallopeptidase [Verrucomicrobia bacterium]|nr:M23 family metallopeptidase [Verrucomicrobiota bacterium]
MITYRQPFRGAWPITQNYGEVIPGITFNGQPHTGIDYGCPTGTEILASAGGIVMKAGWDNTGYGNVIIILHEAKKATLYAHLDKILVCHNELVSQGDVIGLSGASGGTAAYPITGPHLHFEVRKVWNNYTTHQDPVTYLPLMSVDDSIKPVKLKGVDALGRDVIITAPAGAWGWNEEHTKREQVFDYGTKFHYTGRYMVHGNYVYCEVIPAQSYWVAVHDEDTQILDNGDES